MDRILLTTKARRRSWTGEPSGARARARNLKRRGRRRLHPIVVFSAALPHDRTFLDVESVQPKTRRSYLDSLSLWMTFCSKEGLDIESDAQVDASLSTYLNCLFQEGHQPCRGERLLAAYMWRRPDYRRQGVSRLPRPYRCLQELRRHAPGQSWAPMPMAVWTAISAELARTGDLRLAVAVLVSMFAYLSPPPTIVTSWIWPCVATGMTLCRPCSQVVHPDILSHSVPVLVSTEAASEDSC